MSASDLPGVIRDIVTAARMPAIVYCGICAAPILSGTSVTTAVKRETACAACALAEAADIAVRALTLYEPEIDLVTLQRAAEVLSLCAGQFAASVAARRTP